MPRQTPPGRVESIANAACEVFVAKGYRRALMTDVAERLELSHALLYRYVESKEALVELAFRYAMGEQPAVTGDIPLATPKEGDIAELIRSWFALHARFPRLAAASERDRGGGASAELAEIIDELYDFVEQNQLLLLLVESLAGDYPEISADSVDERKRVHNGRLSAFLASRATSGELRPLPDPDIAAHFLSESIAWFAQHRRRDPNAASIDDRQARSSVRGLLLAALVPDAATETA